MEMTSRPNLRQQGSKKIIAPNKNTIQLKRKDHNIRVQIECPLLSDIFVEKESLIQNREVQLRETTIKPLPVILRPQPSWALWG